ncbi:MAG TPA: hypothetical protein VE866_17685, partial [Candidatus Binatia bacterium]|jgi:hypothetical protein|nr:hypothetical protein [Candidatus Binatia bacterium]
LLVFLALTWKHHHSTTGYILVGVALIGILGLAKPGLVRWLFVGASIVAFPIGWVVTLVALLLMFYLIVTPMALVFRWRGRDELRLKRPGGAESLWLERRETPEPGRYLTPF